jgi:hypothetical protein
MICSGRDIGAIGICSIGIVCSGGEGIGAYGVCSVGLSCPCPQNSRLKEEAEFLIALSSKKETDLSFIRWYSRKWNKVDICTRRKRLRDKVST